MVRYPCTQRSRGRSVGGVRGCRHMRDEQRDELSALLARADALMEMRRSPEALLVLEQALRLQPNHARTQCRRALAFLRMNRLREARQAAEQACAADPQEEWAHRLRCLTLLRQGMKTQAYAAAREAVRLKPEGAEANFLLAKTALACGKRTEAADHTARLRALAPNWSVTHAMLGDIAAGRRDWRGAETHYRDALSHEPTDEQVMNALGRMLQHQGRHDEALACFQEATRLAPANDQVRSSILNSLNTYMSRAGYPLVVLILVWLMFAVRPVLGIGALIAGALYAVYQRRARLADLQERAPLLHTLYIHRGRTPRSFHRARVFLIVAILLLVACVSLAGVLSIVLPHR
jgi:tetratricopeptide (TPR) repeat protein